MLHKGESTTHFVKIYNSGKAPDFVMADRFSGAPRQLVIRQRWQFKLTKRLKFADIARLAKSAHTDMNLNSTRKVIVPLVRKCNH
ncbi:hypothetical protein JXJ21_10410 [candidate division KSB1 bacterium]|nr:hypothetical protein [candidate division KSB1 bacterium]